jgi:hypothetical protein
MASRRTGRPSGRPKTKEYATLMARVPQDLVDRVKIYADLHQCTISDLIREGLEWRITEADVDAFLSDRNASARDMARAETDRPSLDARVSDTNSPEVDARVSDMHVGAAGQQPVPRGLDFDHTKFVLSTKLCPRGHDFAGTGRSLLRRSTLGCRECDVEKKRERWHAKR